MAKTKHEVMLSSSFRDLKEHRQIVLEAMREVGLEPINMEDRPQPPSTDTLAASMKMVDEADGFVGIVSHRYGTVNDHAEKNPDGLSLTELEYRRALERKIPMSMFVMSEEHPVKSSEVEKSPELQMKLAKWREHVGANFTYSAFDSLKQLEGKTRLDLRALKEMLDTQRRSDGRAALEGSTQTDGQKLRIRAPALLALPPYTPGHDFVGRTRELILLDNWVKKTEAPVLLLEAIGGMGKSMLTWHWMKTIAANPAHGFAGIFWYSFYEGGATMLDFARRALAYVTDRPLTAIAERSTAAILPFLISSLQQGRWLFVLDGLERVLVAYDRIDASHLRDEALDLPQDPEVWGGRPLRNAHDCIHDSDASLLAQLCQASPSKVMMTSRVAPKALLNHAEQPRPGVQHQILTGLDPGDAELILRDAGIEGSSTRIQIYLQKHFDCHPLIVGVVAGLVRNYRKAPRQFEAWAEDPDEGAEPHLSQWGLVKRRNHILKAAFVNLEVEQRNLLAYMALITTSRDYETLLALNPYLPDGPEQVDEPSPGGADYQLTRLRARHKLATEEETPAIAREIVSRIVLLEETNKRQEAAYDTYLAAKLAWEASDLFKTARPRLDATLIDLERRGLLQWDRNKNIYDLHPVVRGFALDNLDGAGRVKAGTRVANHFEQQTDPPYETAWMIGDVQHGVQVYRALVMAGRYDDAFNLLYSTDLATALVFNLQLPHELRSLLRPVFVNGWASKLRLDDSTSQMDALNVLGIALLELSDLPVAESVFERLLEMAFKNEDHPKKISALAGLGDVYESESMARAFRCCELRLRCAACGDDPDYAFRALMAQCRLNHTRGAFDDADATWSQLLKGSVPSSRRLMRPGELDNLRAWRFLREGRHAEADPLFARALQSATAGFSRPPMNTAWTGIGEVRLMQHRYRDAADAFDVALRMRRESEMLCDYEKSRLAFAKAKHGDRLGALRILDELVENGADEYLSVVHYELGQPEQALAAALKEYAKAWNDGPPFARVWPLDLAKGVLVALGEPEPVMPPFDASKVAPIPFEKELILLIEELEASAADEASAAGGEPEEQSGET